MRKKLFNILNRSYGIMMTVSFFAGFLPLIPFIVAIIIGGETGESIAVFLKNDYYPYVIILGSLSVVVGLVAMYIGKLEGLSVKNVSADNSKNEDNAQENK